MLSFFDKVVFLIAVVAVLAGELDARQKPVRDVGNINLSNPAKIYYFSLGDRYSCRMWGGDSSSPEKVTFNIDFQHTNIWDDMIPLRSLRGVVPLGKRAQITVRNFAKGVITGVAFTPTN
jgi:hypothetical protein